MNSDKKLQTRPKGFNLLVAASIVSIIGALVTSLYLKLDVMMIIIVCCITLFVLTKFAMAMMYTQGWKTFQRRAILGMPVVLFVLYCIVTILIVTLLLINTQQPLKYASSEANILAIGSSALLALLSTFIAWYAGINQWMATGSEYEARMEFKHKGFSDEEIEQRIVTLRNQKIL